MDIRQRVLKSHLKVFLYESFIKDSKDQLVSVYKQRVDMTLPANSWGGCWAGMDASITYRDIEGLVEGGR